MVKKIEDITGLDIVKMAVQRLEWDMKSDPNGLWKTDPDKYVKTILSNPKTYYSAYSSLEGAHKFDSNVPVEEWLPKEQLDIFYAMKIQGAAVIKPLSDIIDESRAVILNASNLNNSYENEVYFNRTAPKKLDDYDDWRINRESLKKIPLSFKSDYSSLGGFNDGFRVSDSFNLKGRLDGKNIYTEYLILYPAANDLVNEHGYRLNTPVKLHFIGDENFYNKGNYQDSWENGLGGKFNSEYGFNLTNEYTPAYKKLAESASVLDKEAQKVVETLNLTVTQNRGDIEKQKLEEVVEYRRLLNDKGFRWQHILKEEFSDFEPKDIGDDMNPMESNPYKYKNNVTYPHELLEFMYRMDRTLHKVHDFDKKLTKDEIFDHINPNSDNFLFRDEFDKMSDKSQDYYRQVYDFFSKQIEDNMPKGRTNDKDIDGNSFEFSYIDEQFHNFFIMTAKRLQEKMKDDGETPLPIKKTTDEMLPEGYHYEKGVLQDGWNSCPCIIDNIMPSFKDFIKFSVLKEAKSLLLVAGIEGAEIGFSSRGIDNNQKENYLS